MRTCYAIKEILEVGPPELSGNGDLVHTDDILDLLETHLSDEWELLGIFSFHGAFQETYPDGDEAYFWGGVKGIQALTKLIEKAQNHEVATSLQEMGYLSGFVFARKEGKGSCKGLNKVGLSMMEMGRYPESESDGDDHFVSCSLIEESFDDITIFGYWFDDSTR